MGEAFESFLDTVKERFKNPFTEKNKTPFAGAFVIALIFVNWELVYSLFCFSDLESRITRIEIIKRYITEKSWHERLLAPVLYAFASIVFFYFLNNISLGITNLARWLKVAVLQLTDRNRLVERAEFEKLERSLIIEKNRRKELKDENVQLEEESESVRIQLKNLTDDFSKEQEKNSELLNKKNELEDIVEQHGLSEINNTRIIYARYGAGERFNDVTAILKKLLIDENSTLNIDNKTLDGDPAPNFIKKLFVVYLRGAETKTLAAIEGVVIGVDTDGLVEKDTNISKRKLNTLENEAKISNIFKGEWTLRFSKDNASNSERVIIDEDGKYFANGVPSFFLKAIEIESKNGKIKFEKIRLDGSKHSIENLRHINDSNISGSNSLGYKLEYVRNEL